MHWVHGRITFASEFVDLLGSSKNSINIGFVYSFWGNDGFAKAEQLSTCLALIEIVDSCNLKCPTCFADSPIGVGESVDAVPLEEIQARIQGVIDRKGGIEILQLSGGEPTLHPQFDILVDWINEHPGIDYLLVNTNGLRLAKDEA